MAAQLGAVHGEEDHGEGSRRSRAGRPDDQGAQGDRGRGGGGGGGGGDQSLAVHVVRPSQSFQVSILFVYSESPPLTFPAG